MDSDRKGLTDVLRQAAEHQGTALVEIYQNCNIFNDGAFDLLKDPATGTQWSIPLVHGQPLVFGPDGASCVVQDDVRWAADRRDQPGRRRRDRRARRAPGEPGLRVRAVPAVLARTCGTRPMGVFRSVQKPTYDAMMADQLEVARTERPADLDALLVGNDTWTVEG